MQLNDQTVNAAGPLVYHHYPLQFHAGRQIQLGDTKTTYTVGVVGKGFITCVNGDHIVTARLVTDVVNIMDI